MTDRPITALVVASLLAFPAFAQDGEPEGDGAPEAPAIEAPAPEPGPITQDQAREDLLEALFERLSDPEADDWEQVQSRINALWNQSGSDSMDLLARRADKAMHAEDYDTALLHLNDLVRLAPGFAEGWNKRATVHFLMGDYGNSLEDIARTLRLEPRHFGALSGLGVILDRVGDSEGALEAYRRVQKINPHLPGAQEGIKKLQREVEGERL